MSCAHIRHDPVTLPDIAGAPQVVARICLDCYEQLPDWWGCEDCETMELRVLSGDRIRFASALCAKHQEE